jgi:hypothetical protein
VVLTADVGASEGTTEERQAPVALTSNAAVFRSRSSGCKSQLGHCREVVGATPTLGISSSGRLISNVTALSARSSGCKSRLEHEGKTRVQFSP